MAETVKGDPLPQAQPFTAEEMTDLLADLRRAIIENVGLFEIHPEDCGRLAATLAELAGLRVVIAELKDERRLLAMLACREPQFSSPLAVMKAEAIRDRALKEEKDNG